MEYSKITNIEIEDVDTRDYPDFCDAYISYAEYEGRPCTDEELEELNDDSDFQYQAIMDYIF